MKRILNIRLIAALAVLAILGTAAYAFTATNTVGGSVAGEGQAAVTGYTDVNLVHYTFSNTDGTITTVRVDVGAAANQVSVRLYNTGSGSGWTGYYGCGYTGSGHVWDCSTPSSGVTVGNFTNISVAAVQ